MTTAPVTIHPNRFPEAVRRDFVRALRAKRLGHHFHYDSPKQATQWLALHEAHSPARRDDDCLRTYTRAFRDATALLPGKNIHVLGLACGGGQKEAQLLKQLKAARKTTSFTATDISVPLVLTTLAAARKFVREEDLAAHVFDLATERALGAQLKTKHSKLITFFGTIHNFEPALILKRLASLMRRGDRLLFSANLAPGADYAAGVKRIFPQYDNPLTRDWLATALLDLGVERGDGAVKFSIQHGTSGLSRVQADFHFTRACSFTAFGESFAFKRGDKVELFYSYRHTPDRLRALTRKAGLNLTHQWLTANGEEGVFLCRRL